MQSLRMHTVQELNELLKHTIFSAIDPASVEKLHPLIERRSVSRGEVIRKIGEEYGDLVLIEEGKFSMCDADHSVLNSLGPGDCIGPLSVIIHTPQMLETQATEDSVILMLDAGSLRMLEYSEPLLIIQLYKCIRLAVSPKFKAVQKLMLELYQS